METDWTPTEKAERHHGQAGSDMKPSRERNKQKRKEDPPPQKKKYTEKGCNERSKGRRILENRLNDTYD